MNITEPQLSSYYFRAEAARQLGVHTATIDRWANTGRIAFDTIRRGSMTWRVYKRSVIDEKKHQLEAHGAL